MQPPMWAPWRIEYILGPKERTGCPFCKYVAGAPSAFREDLTLVRTESAFVCLNRYPFASGHLLVMPKRHVAELTDLTDAEHDELFRLVRSAGSLLKRAVKAEALNIGLNLGAVAGAGIAEHLHVHIVPRWSGDTNFMPVLADTRVMPQALDATWKHLAPHFADIAGEHAPHDVD